MRAARFHKFAFLVAAAVLTAPLVVRAQALVAGSEKYKVEIQVVQSKVGAAASAHVKITPSPGYHLNRDYPTSLKLSAPAAVALAKVALNQRDSEVKIELAQASLDVGYTAKAAGKNNILGILSFAVCSDTTCDPRREHLSIAVDAN